MSRVCKSEPRSFGSDVHRLLQAAEAGQKADILTYYAGHLGPGGLSQSRPHRDTKQVMWKLSRSPEENPNPVTKPQTCAKETSPPELTPGTASLRSDAPAADRSSRASRREDFNLPKIIHSPPKSSHGQRLLGGAAKSKLPPVPKQKNLLCCDHSHHEDQPRCGRSLRVRQEPWAAQGLAERHERKLQKALKELSAQSRPHRDRLAVFSDVFDDVCESSPVFGRILREIKTDYDSYASYMMASWSPAHNMLTETDGRLREMELEDAEAEVCRLEGEARAALEENKRIRNELQRVPAMTDPGDADTKKTCPSDEGTVGTDGVQAKRLQVLSVWRQIQQLEAEIKEELVCDVTEESIKAQQTEIVRLMASNNYMKAANKDLENKINAVLNREKLSKTQRRLLWEEIHCDLQTEELHQREGGVPVPGTGHWP